MDLSKSSIICTESIIFNDFLGSANYIYHRIINGYIMRERFVNFRMAIEEVDRVEKLCNEEHVPRATYLRGCVLKDLAKRGY